MTTPVVAYHLCDLKSGVILEDLPLTTSDPVRNVIAREDTATFTLPVYDPRCPATWQETLVPHKTMIVQTLDREPVQGWAVIDVTVGDATVPVSVATLENCLASTNVPDVDGYLDESQAVAQLCAELPARFGFTVKALLSGRMADVSYSSDEDRSVLDAITERMNTSSGAEWRIVVRWVDSDHRAFDKVLQVAGKVGIVRPDAVFDLDTNGRGTVDSYTRKTAGGPTMLIGASEGSGSSRLITDRLYASDLIGNGWPVWEERKTFTGLGDDVTDEALAAKAQADLDATKQGVTTWTVVGTEDAPRPGRDFDPGDTVHIDVAPRPPRDPSGGRADVRVLGYELDTTSLRVTPILWEDTDG